MKSHTTTKTAKRVTMFIHNSIYLAPATIFSTALYIGNNLNNDILTNNSVVFEGHCIAFNICLENPFRFVEKILNTRLHSTA